MATTVASLIVKIGADLAGLNKGLADAQGKLRGAAGAIGGVAKTIALGVGGALAGVGALSVKTAADFQSQMAIMGVAARNAGVGMGTLSEFALKMGADTFFSASEAADAMTNLFKAGLSWEEVQKRMVPVTDLASASSLGLAQAADVVNIAMSTFGDKAGSAIDVANSFVGAADASVAEVQGLADAFVNVGPTAAQFGWGLADVNTALALLSNKGMQGAEAGTALKSMMTNIMRPTKEVTATLEELNVSLYDQEGHLKTLPELIGSLSEALNGQRTTMLRVGGLTAAQGDELKRLSGVYDRTAVQIRDYEAGIKGASLSEEKRAKKINELRASLEAAGGAMQPLLALQGELIKSTRALTDQEKLEAIQTLGSAYGMKALGALVKEGTEGWEKMEEAISEAATAHDVASARMDTFAGSVESLKGSLETMLIRVGLPLIENFIRPLVEWIDDKIMPAFDTWAQESLPGLIDQLSALASEWGPKIISFLQQMGAFIVSDVIPPLKEFGEYIAERWGTAKYVIAAVGLAILALTAPITAIIGVAALLYLAWQNNWGGIQDKVMGVWAAIQPVFESVKTWLGEKIPVAMAALSTFWNDTLKPAFEGIKEWLETNIPVAIEALMEIWNGTFVPAWEAFKAYADEYLIPLFVKIAELIAAIGNLGFIILAGIWNNTLKPALRSLWSWLATKVGPAIEKVTTFLGTLATDIAETVGPALTTFKEVVIDALAAAFDWLTGAIEAATGWLATAIETVKKIPANLPSWITGHSPSPFENTLWGIAEAARAASGGLSGLVRPALGGFNLGNNPPMALAGVGGARGMSVSQPMIIAPILIDSREYTGANGELDFGRIADRIMREKLF